VTFNLIQHSLWAKALRNATVRITVNLPKQLDLIKSLDYVATKGLITFKVYPKETGFEIVSPEPGLVAVKGFEDDIEYKIYSDGSGSIITMFIYLNKKVAIARYLAELVEFLAAGGVKEGELLSLEASATLYVDQSLPTLYTSEKEYLGKVKVRGVTMFIEGGLVALMPINDGTERTLITIALKGKWAETKRKVLVLDSLAEEALEVVKEWSSQI